MQDQEILKYIKGTIPVTEQEAIEDWITASKENAARFNLLKAQHIASSFHETSKSVNINKAYSLFKNATHSRFSIKQYIVYPVLKYAAMIAIIVGTGYYIYHNQFLDTNQQLSISDETITLQLANGEITTIPNETNQPIINTNGFVIGDQVGRTIIYRNDIPDEKLVYNTLNVPYGKNFRVVLSDGTKVVLNAGSTLKYPVKFIKGFERQVFLTGEGYFDVIKDLKRPFVVNAAGIVNIRVLGTSFNVSAYPEDQFINTVLVEGKVAVYQQDEIYNEQTAIIIEPEHILQLNKSSKKFSIEKVDTRVHKSWIEGKIIFKHLSFKNICKKLQRHYNVVIVNNNKMLDKETFTASFDIETIEEVLMTFDKSYGIKHTIENNKIFIN